MVNVLVKAPDVVNEPPNVKVDAPLLTPVPPLIGDKVPVQPNVMETACNKAVAGVPPNVIVTFVSLTSVKAAGVTPEPAALIVILPGALVIVILVPAVKLAAPGVPVVLPITICPSNICDVNVGAPVMLVTRAAPAAEGRIDMALAVLKTIP